MDPTEQWFHAWRHLHQIKQATDIAAYVAIATLAPLWLYVIFRVQSAITSLPAFDRALTYGLVISGAGVLFWICVSALASGLAAFTLRLVVDARYELPSKDGLQAKLEDSLLTPLDGIGKEYERRGHAHDNSEVA